MTRAALCDERDLAALDFPLVRTALLRHAMTDRGRMMIAALRPGTDAAEIRHEQRATTEMRLLVREAPFSLERVVDVEDALALASRGGTLSGPELRSVSIAVAVARAATKRVRESGLAELVRRARDVPDPGDVASRIERAIDEGGGVLDRASSELSRIRRGIVRAHDEARDRCTALVRSSSVATAIQEPIVTMREGRFVIPVKAEFISSVPGVVHDTSASGQTSFVEPLGAIEANNRLRTLQSLEQHEVARILADLSGAVGAAAPAIAVNVAFLGDIDVILCRARVADLWDAVEPALVDEAWMRIVSGRHPLLGRPAVPQTLSLDDDVRFIVISGPNMGGKTVALKLSGLFLAMAYCGMHLPAADGTTIGRFTRLDVEIGDEQSIELHASTFSAHLQRLRAILETADARTIVLVDEIASGTEPVAGAALAVSVLEELLARGARGIVTTHATELKLFAHDRSSVQNASVRFDRETYAPTYELDLGAPGRSLAFALARSLGFDEEVIAHAERLVSQSERDYDRALSELADLRAQASEERAALERERRGVAEIEARAKQRVESLDRERAALAAKGENELRKALQSFTAELQRRGAARSRAGVTRGEAALLGRTVESLQQTIGVSAKPAAEQRPAAVSVGDAVHVEALGSDGIVAEDFGDTVLVAVGAMKTVVPKTGLRPVGRHAIETSRRRAEQATATIERAARTTGELDVRGRRYVEAEPLVERWLDEARVLGTSPLRLIHGKGTGLLGRGLQEFLRDNDDVASVRYGNADEGGGGVTIVELK